MTRSERSPKAPRATTGRFGMLAALLTGRGTGARKITRGTGAFVVGLICVFTLGLTSSAFGAAPEQPKTEPATGETATTATLNGVLNPLLTPPAKGEAGSYQFRYAPSESGECNGGGVAPASPAFAIGDAKEVVSEPLTGLEPNKEYAFCLVAFSLSAEASTFAPEHFKTLALAPTIHSEGVSRKAKSATLEAVLNPNNEETKYSFEYGTSPTLAGATTVGAGTLEGFGEDGVSGETGEVLTPGTKYYYRVLAENATGKEKGTIKSFTTAIPVETPTATKVVAPSIVATSAEVEGQLNPGHERKSEPGTYEFIYKVSPVAAASTEECEESRAPEPAAAATGALKEAVGPLKLENLQPNAKYTFCLRASNEVGETATGAPVSFKTPPAPPVLEPASLKAANVTPFAMTLTAEVNPNNQPTECHFDYGLTSAADEASKPCEQNGGVLEGYGNQTASLNLTGLKQGTKYFFKVIVKNATGKAELAASETTLTAVAPEIEGESSPEVKVETAKLEATVNPEFQATTCKFEYATSEAELLAGDGTVEPCPAALGDGNGGVVTSVALGGLKYNTPYFYRVLASNASGSKASMPATFTTETALAPTVGEEFATKASSDSVVLHAQVNPGGAATTYRFEYLTEAEFKADGESFIGADKPTSIPSPEGIAGSGAGIVEVQAEAQNLTSGTTYEYRVLASNQVGKEVPGSDKTFTTQRTSGEFVLPDGRAYEMVSPPQKEGAAIQHGLPGIFEAAAGGGAFTYITKTPTESAPSGYDGQSQDLSTRGSSGWTTRDLSVSHELSPGVSFLYGPEYRFFSSDLAQAIVEPLSFFTPCTSPNGTSQPCLSPEASEQTAFLEDTGTHTATPFVTGCPAAGTPCPVPVSEHANVPAGTVFGGVQEGDENKECVVGFFCGPYFVAGTPDLSHVLLESDIGLTTGPGAGGGLYEWSSTSGQLTFVGHGENEAGFESASQQGAFAGHGPHGFSSDGSRVIFKGKSEGKSGLLLRDTASEETVELHEGLGSEENQFQDASADDSRVFFDASWEGELDVWEQTSHPGEPLAGEVTDLTKENGEEKGMRGLVLGASEDGSYVYFVSNGVLGDGAEHGAIAGKDDLYVDHYNGTTWKPTFITTLSSEDSHDWSERAVWDEAWLQRQPTRVSPDGRWLAFMSQASLTGYDNRDARNGKPDAEVYLYHAGSDSGAGPGSLTCASCNPTGARPAGIEYTKISNRSDEAEAGTLEGWGGQNFVAANLPGYRYDVEARSLAINYQPRFLSDGGRLFFNSDDALVPLDTNGTEDVYEYEPASEAVGNCEGTGSSTGSRTFEPARSFEAELEGATEKGESEAGCVGLISSGTSSQESAFLDASEGGGEGEHGAAGTQGGADVFFLTSAQLSPQDQDTEYDVYDAHECTSVSPCIAPVTAPPPCDTEASCKASPTPQPSIYGLPASATFSGPGNLAPAAPAPAAKPKAKVVKCRKGYTKNKKGKCIKKKSKKKAKRATNDRRATR